MVDYHCVLLKMGINVKIASWKPSVTFLQGNASKRASGMPVSAGTLPWKTEDSLMWIVTDVGTEWWYSHGKQGAVWKLFSGTHL